MKGKIERLTFTDGFRQFENRLETYTEGLDFSTGSIVDYIDTLILLDQLDLTFKELEVKLPDNVHAFEIGYGRNWTYAQALYAFLQRYDSDAPRQVTLDGIDKLATGKDIEKLKRRFGEMRINPAPGDVIELSCSEYDFILLNNMLASRGNFRTWGLEPTDLNALMRKSADLLVPDGIQATISPDWAGEYPRLVHHISPDRRLAEFRYQTNLGSEALDSFFTGIGHIYHSNICISRK